MKQSTLVLLIVNILLVSTLNAKHLHKEKYYQDIFCKTLNGKVEYILEDKTRVDCLTDNLAIEVDFASKWAEGIGQSLYYSIKTNKTPAVLLITEQKNKDTKYLRRLIEVAEKYNIVVYSIDANNTVNLERTNQE